MNDLLVLCYHAVSHTWPAALSVTPEALDRQLGQLTRRGYRGARFTDVVLGRAGRGRSVAGTVDDSYPSVLQQAKPILHPHRVPRTPYRPPALAGGPRPLARGAL